MEYRYLEEIATADVAFEARGKDPAEVFTAAAEATVNVMVDEPERIERKEWVTVELEDTGLEMLLFDFLNELVYYKDAKKLLLRVDTMKIRESDGSYSLSAELSGEEIDPAKHPLGADVKAVTLHMFSLEEDSAGWKAIAILDI
ncbi:MAG TPA: archease [Deltaproteobacteria bacterium]|nr:MAG: hypothetical protein A2Z79_12415 [Deltaproteobacteria bacterium GWA2_55_82]OGQ63974.1 MAG: hypothetical protein A3I81_07945 [Deltaproteobacteria bacterium RIFCSPLOWO2_02_FULL_55_12]OIJ73407.1 MAG: hypothetical protein A2V21_303485 [Deltaproteobacteria bacterium GWC2_55_46]HBG47267.1 archease [Deltaproteobacteria bacterium]HCY10033.1 archease [Deltaproteobacteria bacterium]